MMALRCSHNMYIFKILCLPHLNILQLAHSFDKIPPCIHISIVSCHMPANTSQRIVPKCIQLSTRKQFSCDYNLLHTLSLLLIVNAKLSHSLLAPQYPVFCCILISYSYTFFIPGVPLVKLCTSIVGTLNSQRQRLKNSMCYLCSRMSQIRNGIAPWCV